jgi:hypothetical protein
VMDHIAWPYRVIRIGSVPHIDVPEDASVAIDRRVKMPLALRDSNGHAAVTGPRSRPTSPIVVVLCPVRCREFGARPCARCTSPGVIGALHRTELRDELRRVVPRELNTAPRTRSRRLHKTDYTQIQKEVKTWPGQRQ